MLDGGRVLVWFSSWRYKCCGCKIALDKIKVSNLSKFFTATLEVSLNRIVSFWEMWRSGLVARSRSLKNREYKDHFDLIKKTKHINKGGIYLCTTYLKKTLGLSLRGTFCMIYRSLALTHPEIARIERFYAANKEVYLELPFNRTWPDKRWLLAILKSVGIRTTRSIITTEKWILPYKHANRIWLHSKDPG